MSNRLLCLLTLGVVAAACTSDDDKYVSTSESNDHCADGIGVIYTDEVWAKDQNPHRITCNVTLLETLTVGPDTRILVDEGHALLVEGGIRVEGTKGQPVEFAPADDGGTWAGIFVNSSDSDVRFSHTTIESAGQIDNNIKGALNLNAYPATLDHVTIRNSPLCGLNLELKGRLGAGTEDVTVENATYGLCSDVRAVASIPIDAIETEEVLEEGLLVYGAQLSGAHTWIDLDMPYLMRSSVTVNEGHWTLEAGVTMDFSLSYNLIVGGASDAGEATFLVKGTSADPVVFSSEEEEWPGISVLEEGDVSLSNAVIRYATDGLAASSQAAVHVDGVTIEEGEDGLRFQSGASFTADSGTLTMRNLASMGTMPADQVDTLPTGLMLEGIASPTLGVSEGEITRSISWENRGYSYEIEQNAEISVTGEGAPAVLTLDPGIQVSFLSGSRLAVNESATGIIGSLSAVGSAANPIVLSGNGWNGVALNQCASPCELDYVEVTGVGGAATGAIYVGNGSPSIDHADIHDNDTAGLYFEPAASPVVGDVTLTNNSDGDCQPSNHPSCP